MYDELVKALCELSGWGIMDYEDGCGYANGIIKQAADAIEDLSAAVEGYEANTNMVFDRSGNNTVIKFEPKWIPVMERLPEKSGWYLVNVFSFGVRWGEITTKDSAWIQLVFYHEGKFHKLIGSNAKVTHWMPLPTPPKEE